MLRRSLQRTVHRTTMMSFICIGILLGIMATKWGFFVAGLPVVAAAVACVVVAVWKRRAVLVPVALVAGTLLGAVQAGVFLRTLEPYQALYGKETIFEGVVSEDPTYSKKGNRQFFLSDITVNKKKLPGQLFVSTPFSADVRRHDRVAVEGMLKEGFGQFQGSIYFAKVHRVAEEQHAIDDVRARFASAVTSVLPEPHAGLGLGFVIGMKSALPEQMEDALRDLSLTHIIVASGYNLTILVRAVKRLREKKSKLQTLCLSLGLMTLFLFVTGNSPSMVRAAAVTSLALLAWFYGRQFKPHFLLLLVMAATAFWNPVYIWGDLGWWLSFSAFAGIMIIAPLVIERFWKDRKPSFVTQIALEAIIAQLMTLPIILLVFGNFSVLGVVANILICPMVPFAMLATTTAGFVAMISPIIASYVAIPAHVVLAISVNIVNLLSSVPWASRNVSIDIVQASLWYVCICVAAGVFWNRLSRERKQRALMQQIV